MAQLYLVRHAQASFGEEDYDKLSALGHTQSELLGKYFNDRGIGFDHVVVGKMRRHDETAQGILKSINYDGEVLVDDAWNEFDFDTIVKAYLNMHPEQKPSDTAPRSDWYKVLRNAMLAWSSASLSAYNGELWSEFCGRVKKGSERILESDNKRVLLLTSGGAMAVFMQQLLNTSVEQAIAFNLQIKNTSVNEFFFNRRGFQLSTFNNVPHLDCPEHLNKITYS